MVKRILLINSDLASNRGDRAITEGVIALLKERFPQATVTALSEYATRDSAWFGIRFLPMNVHSLNPFHLFTLLREARRSDIVFWGGGELLKDYTNKAALWYWVGKMWLVSLCNHNLYGMYQGIGPTAARTSRRLIRFIVQRCKVFVVRDDASYDRLTSWGCPAQKLIKGVDPAVLPRPTELDGPLRTKLQKSGVDDAVLRQFVVIGPRDWFHYHQGGILPYKYRKKLRLPAKQDRHAEDQHRQYQQQLIHLCHTIQQKGYAIILLPMHMGEEDIKLCHFLKASAADSSTIHILDEDTYSPSEIRTLVASAKAAVGFRLHSTIIATSAGVPSLTYYYVDKGRAYFAQINQSRWASSIETVLQTNFPKKFNADFSDLITHSSSVRKDLKHTNTQLKAQLVTSFATMMRYHD